MQSSTGASPYSSVEVRVRELIHEIAVLKAQTSLQVEISLGKKIIERLFGGNVDAWKRRGRRDGQYRALAGHPELPITAAELYRVVSTYVVSVRLPVISTLKNLAPSHVHAVLPVSAEAQQVLLLPADSECWSVRALQHAVDVLHVPRSGPGRPRKPKILRTLELLAKLGPDAFDDSGALLTLADSEAELHATTATKITAQLEHVIGLLARRSR